MTQYLECGGKSLADWLIVLPSRLASTRLAQKPLQDLAGKPLIVRVYENIKPLVQYGAEIIVATDSEAIINVCRRHDVPVELTRADHPSGTDRCWEVANRHNRPYVMNVQGDEPFVALDDLQALAHALSENPQAHMATLVYRSENAADFAEPSVVKAVRSQSGWALYFSRARVPYPREPMPLAFWQHLGVYAFRRENLERFCAMTPSPLETREKLEQLRALEAGWRIYLATASQPSLGIDTPEDLARARLRYT